MDKIYKKILNGTVTFKQYWKGQPVVDYGIVAPTPPDPDYTEPFYVENINSTTETLNIKKSNGSAPTLTIEYSTDRVNWSVLGSTGTTALTYTLNAGDKVYLRCDTNQGWGYTGTSNFSNRISGISKVGGNIMSLLYGSSFTGNEKTFRNNSYQVFRSLFDTNRTLKDAQHLLLPVTTLAPGCYRSLFYNCSSLTSIPELPATSLADYCYYGMFYGCTGLTAAPALPATTLANSCYYNMFYGCTGLTAAPVLPVTTLANNCYYQMFRGCTGLTAAPVLPATTLATGCYNGMFYGCTGLTAAPALPATTLVSQCYYQMFRGCTNLNYIKCFATNISASNCTSSWVNGVAASGTFVKNPNMTSWPTGTSGIPSGWVSGDFGIKLSSNIGSVSIKAFGFDTDTAYYTIGGGTHMPLNEGVTNIIITEAMDEQTLYVYGEFDGVSEERSMELKWIDVTVPFWVKNEYTKSTRIMVEYADNVLVSLDQITWKDPDSNYVWVPVGEKVYIKCNMRSGTRIWLADPTSTFTSRPMSIGGNYMSLFYGSNFTGYETSFPYEATPNTDGYLFYSQCISAKDLLLPATTLFTGCYSYMFRNQQSLVDAPELPATILVNKCYYWMFVGCSSLNYIKCLATDISAAGCINDWVSGVAATGTFIKNPNMTSWPTGTSGIPSGWTVQDA